MDFSKLVWETPEIVEMDILTDSEQNSPMGQEQGS